MILTEIYRPDLDSVILYADVKRIILKNISNPLSMHSMIFYGSPGVGKTSTAKAIAGHLNADFLKINVAKDMSTEVIKTAITNFVTRKAINSESLKILFLNEFQNLRVDIQRKLNEDIEESFKHVATIIATNDINNIESSIRSRCVQLNFNHPPAEDIIKRLTDIKVKNNLNADVPAIVKYNYPDIRQMLINLELEALVKGDNDYKELLKRIKVKDLDYVFNLDDLDYVKFCEWLVDYMYVAYQTDKNLAYYQKIVYEVSEFIKWQSQNTVSSILFKNLILNII